jgi:hypothetical protein
MKKMTKAQLAELKKQGGSIAGSADPELTPPPPPPPPEPVVEATAEPAAEPVAEAAPAPEPAADEGTTAYAASLETIRSRANRGTIAQLAAVGQEKAGVVYPKRVVHTIERDSETKMLERVVSNFNGIRIVHDFTDRAPNGLLKEVVSTRVSGPAK